jgi:hypothetical protein
MNQLREVNKKLWEIEDKLRQLEKVQRFDKEFINLARSVYIINDERARIKREINFIRIYLLFTILTYSELYIIRAEVISLSLI